MQSIIRFRRLGKQERRSLRNGLLFVSPFLIGFLVFVLYPFLASLYFSFTEYNVFQSPLWVGISNFKTLFTEDDLFKVSLYNTFYYAVFSIIASMIAGITIAIFLNSKIKGLSIYRTIYFLPSILPLVASSVLWVWLLNPLYGIVNIMLGWVGIKGPPWLGDPSWSKPALVIMSTWSSGQTIVILLAGLQGVPDFLYEAAEIDGANWWHKVRYITLPMLSPIIFFVLIIGMIGAFQYFTQAYVMTNGGPANSTLFYSLYLYRNAFMYFKMGYASALAWILFIIIFVCTFLTFKTSSWWVYYERKK